MEPADDGPDGTGETTFHEDRRGVWRVTWTLAYAFGMVAWLMQSGGALLWPLFAGLALALLGLGASALVARRKPLVGVGPQGLRVYAGSVGLGGTGDAGAHTIPWSAIEGVAFEERRAARRRRGEHPMIVTVLCFRLRETAGRPDGHRGFLARLSGREGKMALGEHFEWNPEQRTVDLTGRPQGGFARLTAAIARAAPGLGDASAERRRGLGGPLAHAVYDVGIALAVVVTLVLWATGRMSAYTELARWVMEQGGRVVL